MSTVSSALPAGLQDLSNAGLLPAGLNAQQLQKATPAELTQNVLDSVELDTVSALFGGSSSSSDSVSQSLTSALLGQTSTSATSTTDPILQALDSSLTSASNSATASSTTDGTTISAEATASSTIGSLFSLMG